MDYGVLAGAQMGNAALQQQQRVCAETHMSNIAEAADRIERVADRLVAFLERFHGGPDAAQSADSLTRSGHLATVDRLANVASKLEGIASEAERIG